MSQTCRQDGAVRLDVETDVQVRSTRLTVLPESLQALHTFGTGFAVAMNAGKDPRRSTVSIGREVDFSHGDDDRLRKTPTSRERSTRSANLTTTWAGAPVVGTPTVGVPAIGSKSSTRCELPFSATMPSPADGVVPAAGGLGVADSGTAVDRQPVALAGPTGAVDPEFVEAACALRAALQRIAPVCISSVKVRVPRGTRFPASPPAERQVTHSTLPCRRAST